MKHKYYGQSDSVPISLITTPVQPDYQKKVVLIPAKLNLNDLFVSNPPLIRANYQRPSVIIDHAALLISQIFRALARNKDHKPVDNGGYVSLYSPYLRKLVDDYLSIMKWLEDQGVIEIDHNYLPGSKSKGYRFAAAYSLKHGEKKHYIYLNKHKGKAIKNPHGIDVKSFSMYPELLHDLQLLRISHSSTLNQEYDQLLPQAAKKIRLELLSLSLKKLNQIHNDRGIYNHMEYLIHLRRGSWKQSVLDIDNKDWYFKVDDTAGRLHTNLTSLKKELRKFLRYRGQQLKGVDIKNSQPFILLVMLEQLGIPNSPIMPIIDGHISHLKRGKYKQKYQQLLSLQSSLVSSNKKPLDFNHYRRLVKYGLLYEYMAKKYFLTHGKQISRDIAKTEIFKVFFQPTVFNTKMRNIFMQEFPTISLIIKLINSNYSMTKKQWFNKYGSQRPKNAMNIMACILQNIEAYIILDRVCKSLKNSYPDGLPLFTIHDSILTVEGKERFVTANIRYQFQQLGGSTPTLKIE